MFLLHFESVTLEGKKMSIFQKKTEKKINDEVVSLKNSQSKFFVWPCNINTRLMIMAKKRRENGSCKHLFSIGNMWLPDVLKNRVSDIFQSSVKLVFIKYHAVKH